VLAGAGVLATAGVAELVPLGGINGRTPREDTWPLARYDLANTASTDATPPADPSIAWSDDSLHPQIRTGLVVGPERVYAGGGGLAVLDRSGGDERWYDGNGGSGHLALREGTLYSATAGSGTLGDSTLRAFDAETGSLRWEHGLPFEATSLRVAGGAVFVAPGSAVAGYDADTGRRRWSAPVPEESYLAVHGGDLYAGVEIHTVTRFRGRDLLDVPLGSGPGVRWESEVPMTDVTGPPVVGSDRVYARQRGRDRPALAACLRASGEGVWTAVSPGSGSERVVGATALAVEEGRSGVAGVARETDDDWRHCVLGFDPADGRTGWRSDLGARRVSAAAVADGLALVGTTDLAADSSGSVRASGLDSGEARWQVDLPAGVGALAPVEGTVFVACRDGSVHALRD
jgi:outer membrane protein assembly factor BamB